MTATHPDPDAGAIAGAAADATAGMGGGPDAAREGDAWAPVVILTPTGRDGDVARAVLARAGFAPVVSSDVGALCAAIDAGAGVLLVTEEALRGGARGALLAALDAQPPWSDVPVVVLTGDGELSETLSPALATMAARGNVTLLERPVRVATLVTTLRAALRARRRQFDVRDHLEQRRVAEATLRESEAHLRAAREQAEDANRAKSEFLAVMSHELRTPLNAIAGYAELIELGVRGPITAEQREDLERIRRSQRHLLGLINEVLNYARLETGRVRYALRNVSAAAAVAAVEALVLPQLREKSLTLDTAGCDRAVVVRADAEKLQQILVNLLSNAVKFTDRGGHIEVACAVTGDASGGAMAEIAVRDTGAGIAADKLEVIFEPFVQVGRALNSPSEGTGLGLAISRDLARAMGGDLTARSTEGEGSAFTVTLRRAPTPNDAPGAA